MNFETLAQGPGAGTELSKRAVHKFELTLAVWFVHTALRALHSEQNSRSVKCRLVFNKSACGRLTQTLGDVRVKCLFDFNKKSLLCTLFVVRCALTVLAASYLDEFTLNAVTSVRSLILVTAAVRRSVCHNVVCTPTRTNDAGTAPQEDDVQDWTTRRTRSRRDCGCRLLWCLH